MPTENPAWPSPALRSAANVLVFYAALTFGAVPLTAQAPLSLVNTDTQVEALGFRFVEQATFSRRQLQDRIGLRGPRNLARLTQKLSFLPLVSPGSYPFSPLELQRDLVRLRRFYAQSGFPRREIDYEVTLDSASNRVRIAFVINEGAPVLRGTVRAVDESGSDPVSVLPADLGADWPTLLDALSPSRGARMGDLERIGIESRVAGWLRDRGYPLATVESELQVDSAASIADVTLRIRTGVRARIGSVRIEGNRALSERVLMRELGVEPGDPFSAAQLAEGERQLFGLDLVRLAVADVPSEAMTDSTVEVRVRVQEGLTRLVSGQLGYASEAGVTGQADWTHRNFTGSARTLTVSSQARTGWLGIGANVERRYTASVSLKQPYLFHRRFSLVVTPQAEYRDDLRDRSGRVGTDAAVVYERGTLRSVALQLGLARRRIFDYRVGGTEGLDYLSVLATLDSLNQDVYSSTVGATVTWGAVDDPVSPRQGYIVRAAVEVTGPPALTTVQYRRLDASVTRFLALAAERTGVTFRASVGRLYPHGKSIPAGTDPTASFLELRDVLFTAGGGYDVRGWGEQQLGPKFPDIRVVTTGADTSLTAERYVPLGGLARVSASMELRMPFPGAGPRHSSFVFFDAGKIWNPDSRFGGAVQPESKLFASTGTGFEWGTPIGPLRVSVGYKLNPSELDLRDPQAVLDAIVRRDPVSSVPVAGIRRWHLHLVVGHSL